MHRSHSPAKGTSEQHPAGTPFFRKRGFGAASDVQESRIQVAVCGKQPSLTILSNPALLASLCDPTLNPRTCSE